MENYFSFNEKALAVVGVNLEKPGRFDKPLKVISLTVLSVATFQNFMYAALSDGVSFDLANAVTLTLYGTMGVAKLLTAFLHQEELGRIKEKFGKLVKDLDDNEKARYSRELNLYRRITKVFVLTGLSNTSMFNIMPVAIYISSFLQQGVAIKVFSYALWYPFDKQEYFIVVYLWECFCSCYWCTVFLIVDGLVILLIGQAVVLFKNVGETMSQIIDDFETSPKESSRKLKEVIEYHSVLLDLVASLIRIYEAPLLVNVLVQTGCIGMVTFIVSIQDVVLPPFLGLLNCLSQVYLVCWIGEKIKESSLSVSDKIPESKFYNLDDSLKRDLVMIIRRSQKVLNLKGSKFFRIKMSLFTSIVRTAFSYFTFVRRAHGAKDCENLHYGEKC